MTTLHLRKSIDRSPLRRGFPVVLVVLGLFALSRTALAVDPPPDGGYPNNNTAEGDYALFSLTIGSNNTAIGNSALFSNIDGNDNTAIGYSALANNAGTGGGNDNTAIGSQALARVHDGGANTAIGSGALSQNINSSNTAIGAGALTGNAAGNSNTATGVLALAGNDSGSYNTADGVYALFSNTSGYRNTATGYLALEVNSTGRDNTATGYGALQGSTTGQGNTATGYNALVSNSTGEFNAATGYQALFRNTMGYQNTATGPDALLSNTAGARNTACGAVALSRNTSGSLNIAVGFNAGGNLTSGSNNIDIGNKGVAGEAAKIRIGTAGTQTAAFIAGIHAAPVTGTAVVVSGNGQLGVAASSERFKEAIKPMDKASEAILALKPVTFRYKHELDPDGVPQFGLVAEQVEKVNPDLVIRGEDGKVITVRYEAVNAMLLNEFLKEHRKVQDLEKQVTALTAGLQKVTARLEAANSAPRVVSGQ